MIFAAHRRVPRPELGGGGSWEDRLPKQMTEPRKAMQRIAFHQIAMHQEAQA